MRELIETRNEADAFIYSIEKLIKDNESVIDPAEKEETGGAIEVLKKAMESDNVNEIRDAKSKLEGAGAAVELA